jgi:hypothetical protein
VSAPVINLFEQNAREQKAAKLVVEIDLLFSTLRIQTLAHAAVQSWGDDDWKKIADLAKVNPPSAATRAMVLGLLKARLDNQAEGA